MTHKEFSSKGGKAQPKEAKRLGGKLRWAGSTKEQRAEQMRRVRAGLTQTQAAKAEGVSLRRWKYWEKGEQLPPAERDVLTRERLLARWKTKKAAPGPSNVPDEQRHE